MLKHIGITVNYPDDIDQFYQKVLMFSTVHKFNLDLALSALLFSIEESPEVFLLYNNGVELEVFVSETNEKKAYTHICLEYANADKVYSNAIELSYKAIKKPNRNGGFTYFIYDKSGNVFEVKEKN